MEGADSVRGILKVGGTYAESNTLKTAKFDEMNVLATFHPEGKDYGHMVIDEPKTPFVFEEDLPHDLDTATLMEKLRLAAQSETPSFGMDNDSDDSSDDEDYPESVDEKVRRLEFERRRKLHYKEFLSVPLARRLIAEEFGDMSSPEVTLKDETVQSEISCSAEECSTNEKLSDKSGRSQYSYLSNMSFLESMDYNIPPPEIEPGYTLGHRCYQKLMAQLVDKGDSNATLQPHPTESQSAAAEAGDAAAAGSAADSVAGAPNAAEDAAKTVTKIEEKKPSVPNKQPVNAIC